MNIIRVGGELTIGGQDPRETVAADPTGMTVLSPTYLTLEAVDRQARFHRQPQVPVEYGGLTLEQRDPDYAHITRERPAPTSNLEMPADVVRLHAGQAEIFEDKRRALIGGEAIAFFGADPIPQREREREPSFMKRLFSHAGRSVLQRLVPKRVAVN